CAARPLYRGDGVLDRAHRVSVELDRPRARRVFDALSAARTGNGEGGRGLVDHPGQHELVGAQATTTRLIAQLAERRQGRSAKRPAERRIGEEGLAGLGAVVKNAVLLDLTRERVPP